ncbi:MAG: hypothetical protein JSS02_06410, partial [Planctomycetes bacterium]|nr:hypothetical protein [Planctomycetota bacterium]
MPKSDHPWWRKFFSKSWSRTLRQSVDNPLQTERLPADAAPEFDYPVQSESRAASRYITFKACLFTLLPTAVFAVLVRCMTFLATDLLVLSFVSSVAYLAYHLAPPEPLLRKLAFAMAGMLLSFLLLTLLPLTMACCSVATIGILILADRFATHCISLATAAPTARATAFEIRRLWCDRFATLQRPLRGAELYPFGFITVLLLVSFWIQYFQAVDRPRDPHNLLQAFLWPSALTIGGTLLVEIGVAFLYQRRPTSFLQMIPALWCALVDWHCYNSRESSALGIHRTPAGSNAARRRLLLGVFFLWFLVFTSIHAQFPQRHQNEADVADAPTPLQLTPVEQHYVDHLSESDAEAYRRDRAAAIAIPRPRLQPAATSGAYSPFTSTDGSDAAATIFAPWYTQLLNVAYQFFLVIYFFLKLGLLAAAFTATAIFAATARVVTIWNRGSSDSRVFNTANWDHLVARIQNSSDPTEQNSLILGVNAADDSPVLVPRDVFREHAHILGDSGSGKTSLGIMPLMMQLLRQGTCSVIVIDLKADDQVLFETISREAAAVGRRFQSLEPEHPGFPFRWFTTEVGRATYAFNPLRQSFLQNLRDDQRTDLLTAALG